VDRIAFLTKRDILYSGGGGDLYVHELAKRLASEYDVSVIATRIGGGPITEYVDNIRVTRIGSLEAISRLRVPLYLIRHLKEIDVIIENVTVIPWMTPLFTSKPRVAIVHQLLREIFFHELPRVVAWPAYAIEPLLYKPYKNVPIVCPAGETTIKSLTNVGLRSENIIPISCGVSQKYLDIGREALTRKSESPTILVMTRLEAYKRVDWALYAMKRVLRSCPTAHMIIVGDGRQLNRLKVLTSQLNMSANVTFRGFVSEEEKMRLLAEAHVHIWSLGYRDGCGLSILEANAFWTPSIAWNAIGPSDTILDGETGILVPYGDICRLSESLLSILTNSEFRLRLAMNAYRLACRHSWDLAASQFSSIIEGLLARGKSDS